MTDKETVIINQPVDKDAYKKIKAIAALSDKKIQDVINDALVFYVNNKEKGRK